MFVTAPRLSGAGRLPVTAEATLLVSFPKTCSFRPDTCNSFDRLGPGGRKAGRKSTRFGAIVTQCSEILVLVTHATKKQQIVAGSHGGLATTTQDNTVQLLESWAAWRKHSAKLLGPLCFSMAKILKMPGTCSLHIWRSAFSSKHDSCKVSEAQGGWMRSVLGAPGSALKHGVRAVRYSVR